MGCALSVSLTDQLAFQVLPRSGRLRRDGPPNGRDVLEVVRFPALVGILGVRDRNDDDRLPSPLAVLHRDFAHFPRELASQIRGMG